MRPDLTLAERAAELVADWPPFSADQLDAVRRIVAPVLTQTAPAQRRTAAHAA